MATYISKQTFRDTNVFFFTFINVDSLNDKINQNRCKVESLLNV